MCFIDNHYKIVDGTPFYSLSLYSFFFSNYAYTFTFRKNEI